MIKQLTIDELPSIVVLADKFFAETKLPDKFNQGAIENTLRTMMGLGVVEIWVDQDDGKIIGAAAILFGPDLHTGELTCNELFWYVFPEYRGKTSGLRLFFTLLDRAHKRNAKFMIMAALVDSPSFTSVCKLYKKCGFEPLEVLYRKAIT